MVKMTEKPEEEDVLNLAEIEIMLQNGQKPEISFIIGKN